MNEVYRRVAEPTLVEPMFVLRLPARGLAAGARAPRRPALVERFEVVVGGLELAQRLQRAERPGRAARALRGEARPKAAGDPEAGDVDEDYVRALEYGLPPTGGLGIGIDRLVMLLAGATTSAR